MKNIKKVFLLPLATISFIFTIACKDKIDHPKNIEEKITTLDKEGWQAWMNKNGKWFELNTTKNFISISADGVSTKEQVIKSTVSDCEIKSFTLSKMEFTLLTQESALLTYTVDQDGMCGGVKLNSKIRVAANYIKQNDKWLEAFYMESKIN